jgi:16S rRNA (guanine966-N2)-methyltransferase
MSKKNAHKITSSKKAFTRPGQTSLGEVRIIGGQWRGRKLPVLSQDGLRPTSDRVRETLFNWLQFTVPGAKCLDVFAGSGALGLEALSRGARSVTFLELSTAACAQLKTNIITLKIVPPHATVVQGDSLQWLEQSPVNSALPTINDTAQSHFMGFDVVFVDPPFNQGLMQLAVDKLLKSALLNPHQAWLYLEQEKDLPWPNLPSDWHCYREKTTSQVRYGLFCRGVDENE